MIAKCLRFIGTRVKKVEVSYGVVPIRRGTLGTEVLFCKSNREGRFMLPKGRAEDGESEIQAAVRELWEEAGCRPVMFWRQNGWTEEVEKAQQLPLLEYGFLKGKVYVRKEVRFYLAEVVQEADVQDKDECSYAKWFLCNRENANLLGFQENVQHFVQHVLDKV